MHEQRKSINCCRVLTMALSCVLLFLGDSKITGSPLANCKEHRRQLCSAYETKLLALMNSDLLMLVPLEASNCDVRNLLRGRE
jgi:hypothetical protein